MKFDFYETVKSVFFERNVNTEDVVPLLLWLSVWGVLHYIIVWNLLDATWSLVSLFWDKGRIPDAWDLVRNVCVILLAWAVVLDMKK